MALNIPGLIAIMLFYLVVFVVGIIAARLTRKRKSQTEAETIIVGGRDIGTVVGFFTLTATWVGGDYINGTAEAVYTPNTGLMTALCLIIGYGVGMAIVGIFFVDKLRDNGYTTIVDPYEEKLGKYMGAVLGIVEMFCITIFTGSSLNAIGGSLEIVTGVHRIVSVIISAIIVLLYTLVGGLYSVAYTDVLQISFIFGGLVLCLPFTFTHEAVANVLDTSHGEGGWIGSWDPSTSGAYIDLILLCIFGGVPWQALIQRVLAAKSNKSAKILCVASAFGACLMAVPPVLIGAVGASTNWTLTTYMNGTGLSPYDVGDERLILPIVLLHLTPPIVAFFGLGSVAAAIMSSADSATLACGSLFGKNVYKSIIRPNASDREIVWIIRTGFIFFISLSAFVALTVDSIFALAILSSDFIYVLCFPQFVSVFYFDPNVYGSMIGFLVGLVLRLGGGEATLDWEPWIHYPGGARFPYKTVATFVSFMAINFVSAIAKELFSKGYLSEKYDILKGNLCHGGRSNTAKPRNSTTSDTNKEINLTNMSSNVQLTDSVNNLKTISSE